MAAEEDLPGALRTSSRAEEAFLITWETHSLSAASLQKREKQGFRSARSPMDFSLSTVQSISNVTINSIINDNIS